MLIFRVCFVFLHDLTWWSNFVKIEVFEQVAKNAVRGLWARRSNLDLVGAHINVFTGEWTQKVTKMASVYVRRTTVFGILQLIT